MKRFFKSVGFKILAGIALVLAGVMIYAAVTPGASIFPANVSGAVLAPLQSFVTSVGDAFSTGFGLFADTKAIKDENAELKKELNALRDQLVDYDEMSDRYEELIRYLELKEQNPDYKFADARVISRDPADHFGNFVINAGTGAGIAVGDPVITADGLVGVVAETGISWSKVSTILDTDTHVSAYVSRTQDTGTTGGTLRLAEENRLQLQYLEREAGVTSGDYVVTAGGNSQYPAKLRIGKITEVIASSDGLSITATIEPFADVRHVTDVLVLIDFEAEP